MPPDPNGRFLLRKWRQFRRGRSHPDDIVPASDLALHMGQGSVFSFSFFLMLALAAAIATFGLIANSAPAIIGAMIIAPLMAPIISFAYGLAVFDKQLITSSILTVIAGTILVVGLGWLITLVFGLRITGSEILNRTTPTVIDLGVAMAAGGAAAFASTRKSIMSSIAGVAIAVALVPPLAVSGIGLALRGKATADTGLSLSQVGLYAGGTDIALGAFLLFLTNLVGIIAVAILVFTFQGYAKRVKAVLALFLCVGFLTALAFPLEHGLHRLYAKHRAVRLLSKLPEVRPDILSGEVKIDGVAVTYQDGLLHFRISGVVPRDLPGDQPIAEYVQSRIQDFQDYLVGDLGEPVVVEFDAIVADVLHFRGKGREPQAANGQADNRSD